ncbi:hypothetical protein DXG01_009181, partial [Tephrocybe rancida]
TSDATRSVLHGVAAADSAGSKYDVNLPITRNIDLPSTLISRFDLLYLVLDRVGEALDRMLAQHLADIYLEEKLGRSDDGILSLQELSAYIDYARSMIHPVITGTKLVRANDMRN